MGTHIAMRNHIAFIANGTQERRRSNSNAKVEFQKFKCETLFTALDPSSYLRSSAFIALDDPSLVFDDH